MESVIAFSQAKPVVDEKAIENWSTVSRTAAISATGKYVAYGISDLQNSSVLVQGENGKIIKRFPNLNLWKSSFVGDAYFIYLNKDSLYALSLAQQTTRSLAASSDFRPLPHGSVYDLLYLEKQKNSKRNAVLLTLSTGEKKVLSDVNSLNEIANDGSRLNSTSVTLKTDSNGINSVWLKDSFKKESRIGDDQELQKKEKLKISEAKWSPGNGSVRLKLAPVVTKKNLKQQSNVKLNLWSYTDINNQSFQAEYPEPPIFFSALMLLRSGQIIVLEDRQNQAVFNNEHGWLIRNRNPLKQVFGPNEAIGKFKYLISENDGRRTDLTEMDSVCRKANVYLTKNNNFIIYFNADRGDYLSYNTLTHVTVNLTERTGRFKDVNENDGSGAKRYWAAYQPRDGVLETSDGKLIIFDENDLWKIDPRGIADPVCLTNHYGKKQGIVFRIYDGSEDSIKKNIIVKGFCPATKRDGFFSVSLKHAADPVKIVYDDAIISGRDGKLIKAINNNIWLFRKSTASESPNWYLTDGKTVKQISYIAPEKKYNWMTAELLSWKTKKGVSIKGILYKPENMDTTRKYPVIITYYESKSDELHKFHIPELKGVAEANIPWMVSRGYLVFVPDMKYRVGEAGRSALECLDSGTDELIKRQYVDGNRLGLTGHSWGGFETAYFVSHSNRYKAALIGAASTDQVSKYNDWIPNAIAKEHGGQHNRVEWAQGGTSTTLWDRPDWYIDNSPVFNADKVNTPVLMMHNKGDANVAFGLGAEFFLSLYRLGKPAWLLEYEKESHIIGNRDNQLDFTTRVTQFFDFYLKGAPAPLWMLDATSLTDRDYKAGLELDTLGRAPGKSPLITEAEQKRIDEYSKIPLSEKLRRIKN